MQQDAFEIIDGDLTKGFLLLADHASAYIPPQYNNLGLDESQLNRHIAYDIGTREFTIKLAKRLNLPAVLSNFSRLLIDPNRGLLDPTLVMRVADGQIINGNRHINSSEKQLRVENFYKPYNDAIKSMIAKFADSPSLLSIHSFTPYWRGNKRDTQLGLLWADDDRLTNRLYEALRENTEYIIHLNKPYSGGLVGDTLDRHGLDNGFNHALLELRQDYLATTSGIDLWVDIFADILPQIMD